MFLLALRRRSRAAARSHPAVPRLAGDRRPARRADARRARRRPSSGRSAPPPRPAPRWSSPRSPISSSTCCCSCSCSSPSPHRLAPGPRWWLLGAGLAVCALADAIYISRSRRHLRPASWLDTLWPPAFIAIALAAWQRTARAYPRPRRLDDGLDPARRLRVSIARARPRRPTHGGPLTLLLAAPRSSPARPRAADAQPRTSRCCAARRREALTDKLTELPNRRALIDDLDARRAPAARTRSSSSTSTASRTTTTRSATPRATRCCAASRPRSPPSAAAPTGSAATSSACWSTAR